jgi:hypothetical protein
MRLNNDQSEQEIVMFKASETISDCCGLEIKEEIIK